LASLLARAGELEAKLSTAVTRVESSDEERSLSYAARRLQRSVIRPIDEALQRLG
jgi:hypothetical protein